jgi:hypothetical protein
MILPVMRYCLLLVLLLAGLCSTAQPLRVAPNGRHLVDGQGKPFFYLGDTAWEIFVRLTREEAEQYLENRAAKGFTVIEAPVLPIFGRLQAPNAYGQVPLHGQDPDRPNEAYFELVDYVIDAANARSLYFALAPTWGDKVSMTAWSGSGPEIFTPEKARRYGEWIGRRYRNKRIIWMLGGDRNPEKPEHLAVWRAMAAGIEAGTGGNGLLTYHPEGPGNSAAYFHDDPWLDFNMVQSGHSRKDYPCDSLIRINYARQPPKPTLDGEPRYEDHPVDWKPAKGWFDDFDVRQAAYWALLAGAAGHVYGNHNVWQFWQPGREPISHARTPWQRALDHPGAAQMGYVRKLFESVAWTTLVPIPDLLQDPNTGTGRQVAAAAADGTLLVAYSPLGEPVRVDAGKFPLYSVTARWFDPRHGTFQKVQQLAGDGKPFVPPTKGRGQDWLLVLEKSTLR